MWERGLMKHEWQKWRPTKPQCVLKRDVVSVEISTISFAFSLLAFGLFASVSILIIERLYYDRYFQIMTKIHLYECYASGSLVTMARRILRLPIEETTPATEGSREYIE
jgi:hypothetical protein